MQGCFDAFRARWGEVEARGLRDGKAIAAWREGSLASRPWPSVAAIAALNKGNQGNGRGNLPPAYRLYEVQNGNHIETYKDTFPALELIQPHAQRAFDLLVGQVEAGATLPPDQCIPRGGEISAAPAQPGHCVNLFVP